MKNSNSKSNEQIEEILYDLVMLNGIVEADDIKHDTQYHTALSELNTLLQQTALEAKIEELERAFRAIEAFPNGTGLINAKKRLDVLKAKQEKGS